MLVDPNERLEHELNLKLEFYRNIKNLYSELAGEDPGGDISRKLKLVIEFIDARVEPKFREHFSSFDLLGSTLEDALLSRKDHRALDKILTESHTMRAELGSARSDEQANSFVPKNLGQGLWRLISPAITNNRTRPIVTALDSIVHNRCRRTEAELNIYNAAKTIESKPLAEMLAKMSFRFQKLNEHNKRCLLCQSAASREPENVILSRLRGTRY